MEGPYPSPRFNVWTLIHSGVCLGACLASLALRDERLGRSLPAAACAYSFAAFAALFLLQGESSLRAPNFVSLARLVGAAYALLSVAFPLPGGWIFFWVVAASSASDLADGALARRSGPTPFGGKLDMELDAFNMFALSTAAFFLFQAGARVLLLGLMRYCYVFALLVLPDAAPVPRWTSLAEKTFCAIAVAVLVVVSAPVLAAGVRGALVTAAVGLLTLSFGIDLAVRLRGNVRKNGVPALKSRAL